MRTARGLGEEVPRLLPANSSSTDDASLKTEVVSPDGSPLSLTLSESPSTKRAGQCLSEDERPSKERRRVCHRPVANACTTCRKAKVKCSGKHPTCIRCLERGLACEYDVAQEGISKVKDLRQKLDVRTGELSSATKLLNVLRTSSDEVAAEVLARLRLGQSNEQIQERLRDIQSTTPSQSGSPSSPHPSIRDSTDAITAPLEHQDRNALPQSTVEPLGRRYTYEAQFASLASLYYHNMAMATAEASGTRMHGVEMGSLIDPAVLTDGSTGLEPNARGT